MTIMITGTVMANINVHATTTKSENKKASDKRSGWIFEGFFLGADIPILAMFISQMPIV